MSAYLRALPGLILMACTPPEGEEDMTTTPVKCDVSATTVFEPVGRIVRGTGTITCDTPADVSLKVCLYSKGIHENSWGDPLQCLSTAGSARTTISTEVAVRISPGAAKMYRTVVSAQVNSVDQPEQESTHITAP